MDLAENKPGAITRIGKYDIVEVLGRGGMGVVYRAMDNQLGREVAIKTLTQGVNGNPDLLARFYKEGRGTAMLKHPHIVTVYDLGDDNGTPYIVMECVEGEPLDKVIKSEEPMAMVDRLRIVEEVCSALGYAHRNNLIHRDVKPANIFVQPDGRAKLLDFGIARLDNTSQDLTLTRAGHIIGTIPYMAPERLRNKFVDSRSDIFSAGVVLYQLVTGQLPFSGEEYVLMQKIMNEPHPPLSSIRRGLPSSLDPIIDRALAKQADDRYQTGEEMSADLTTVIADLRQEQIVEMVPEARRLMDAGELTKARGVLHQLLKIQSKHPEARELLAEIQKRLMQRQREERIQQVRQQALEALDKRQFDPALSFIRDGLELDKANPELLELQERIQKEKSKQDRIDELLREADGARRKGDYKNAIALAQQAQTVDQSNSRVMAVSSSLVAEAEEAQKRAKAGALLASARGHLDGRRYNDALGVLHEVEQLDPTNPEVQLLVGDANAGLEQIRRREWIARLEEEVSRATTIAQLQQASQSIEDAIASMPNEPGLFPLNAQVERRIKDLENRQLVDNTLQSCRDLRPREALELVRQVRLKLPAEERLMSLEALLLERLGQQTAEERRAGYLSRSREALKNGQFTDAVLILEACEAEGIGGDEVAGLLEFARSEEAEQRRNNMLRSNLERAQAFIAAGAFADAIAFLESALTQSDDASLRMLLEQAVSAQQTVQKQISAALAAAGRLVQAGKTGDAIHFLETLPADVLRSKRVQTSLAALQDQRWQVVFRTTGRAYGALPKDLSGGDATMRRVAAASGNSAYAEVLAAAYRARGRSVADQTMHAAVQQGEASLRNKDKAAADNALKAAAPVLDWASPEMRSNWQNLVGRLSKKGLLARAHN